MTRGTADRASRAFAIIAFISAVWAIAVILTGGVALDSGVLRLSSRTPRNPSILSALSGLVAWMLASPRQRHRWISATVGVARHAAATFLRLTDLPRHSAPVVGAIAAVGILWVGLAKGTHIAGGADSYGYTSQADLWSHATLRVDQPLMDHLSSVFARSALAPLGYRPALQGPAIVPVYGAGLPIVMAAFQLIAGRSAVFYVVPVMGALAVWATYMMGSRLAGGAVGAIGAVLLATSPVFLYQVVQPMSDVPVTAWWALTLALLMVNRRGASLAAGLYAGLAIVTRANLAPLLAVIAAFLIWERTSSRKPSTRGAGRGLAFAAGALPGCLIVVALNQYWYGSPLDNGYGRFSYLYEWANLWPNLMRYPRWLLDAETPLVLLAAVAPFLLPSGVAADEVAVHRPNRRAVALMWLAFSIVVFVSYAFYAPFDVWWYLRFLLPALPPLCVLVAVAVSTLATQLAGRGRVLVGAFVVALAAWHGVAYARNRSAFDLREGERKYVAVGQYIAARLPEHAIFLAIQHGGSARYYSGRLTIRYDRVDGEGLDLALDELVRLGYHPYFLLDADEEPDFRARFAAHSPLGALDWVPVARLRQDPGSRIYDPSDKGAAAEHRRAAADIIDESAYGPRGLTVSP